MAEAIFVFILFVPIFLWTLLCYPEEPEVSKEAILMVRIGTVAGILFCTAFLVSKIIALF